MRKNVNDDKELLEMAAKAAGYEAVRPATFGMDCWMALIEGEWQPWNPLTEDGDALRLAVKLNLSLVDYKGDDGLRTTSVRHWHREDDVAGFLFEQEAHGDDPCAATRRAIVRAAASIGSKS